MIDYNAGTRLMLGEGDGLVQIMIYVVVGAFMLLGNIGKARAQKKRTRHTDVPRPELKPPGRRMRPQESPPRPRPDKTERLPKYYPPGGFAEALLDETLEETLKNRSKRGVKFHADDEEVAIPPIEGTEVMEHDLESMGHLETLDLVVSSQSQEDPVDAIAGLISIDGPDDLARAVVYAEILSKPVGLRGF